MYYMNYVQNHLAFEEHWWVQTLSVLGSQVLTALVMKSSVFWDITPYSSLKVNQRFGAATHNQSLYWLSCSS
jgi:hypothetical protein